MDKTKKIISLLLFVIYVSYYVNTNFFIHTHQSVWGTVTHSHPYTSTAHTHSTNALQLIESLTTLLFIGGAAILYLTLLPVTIEFFLFIETKHASSLHISNLLRAPPVLA